MTTLIIAASALDAERYRRLAGIDRRAARTALWPGDLDAVAAADTRIVLVRGWSRRRARRDAVRCLQRVAGYRADGARVLHADLDDDAALRLRAPRQAA